MAYSSNLGPRFQDYLNGLRAEFESLSNATSSTKTSGPRFFDVCLWNLKREIEQMVLKIESLQKERDERVTELQNLRLISCERCCKGARPKTKKPSWFSIPFIQSKSLNKLGSADQTRQHRTALNRSAIKSTIIALPSPLQRASTADPDSCSKGLNWSITFNDQVANEFNVESVHVFSHRRPIFCVNFSQDGKYLAAGCDDGKAYIYDVETGALTRSLKRLVTEKGRISSVREGEDLATNSSKGDIKDRINSVRFSRDGTYLATGSSDGGIYIWKINSKYVRNAFKRHTGFICSLDFSPNDRLVVSTSYDNSVLLWNMRDGAAKFLTEDNPTFLDDPSYSSAVFSPDGRYVAASHRDGIVRVWDVRTTQLVRRVQAHMCRVYDVVFIPDGRGLVSGGKDMTLKSWDISSLYATQFRARPHTEEQTRLERKFFGHKDSIRSLAISPDGKWVASGSYDQSLRIWDTRTAAMQCSLDNVHKIVGTVDFSPVGLYFASGGDGMVRIWRYSYAPTGGS